MTISLSCLGVDLFPEFAHTTCLGPEDAGGGRISSEFAELAGEVAPEDAGNSSEGICKIGNDLLPRGDNAGCCLLGGEIAAKKASATRPGLDARPTGELHAELGPAGFPSFVGRFVELFTTLSG